MRLLLLYGCENWPIWDGNVRSPPSSNDRLPFNDSILTKLCFLPLRLGRKYRYPFLNIVQWWRRYHKGLVSIIPLEPAGWDPIYCLIQWFGMLSDSVWKSEAVLLRFSAGFSVKSKGTVSFKKNHFYSFTAYYNEISFFMLL